MTDAGEILIYTATSAKLVSILKNLIIDPLFKPKKYLQNYPKAIIDFERQIRLLEVIFDIEPGGKLGLSKGITIPMPDYGKIESIEAFDLLINNPLEFTRREKPAKKEIILHFNEPKSVQKIKLLIKISIDDRNYFRGLIREKIIIQRRNFFTFLAEVILENTTDDLIKNYLVAVPISKVDLTFPELTLISKRKDRTRDKHKEERFQKMVKKKLKDIQIDELIRTISVIYNNENAVWTVKSVDPNCPLAQRISFHQKGFSSEGELIFYTNFRPRETLSYQVLGPDLSKIIQQETIKEEKKK